MKKTTAHNLLDQIDYEFARTSPPNWFPDLPRIPAARYLDEEFFALEMEALKKCWVIIGTVHEFPEAGSFKVVDRWNGAGVVIVRGHDHKLRAFYNTCQHRGAPVVREECGTAKRLTCKFHSWSYELDGSLAGIPGRRDFHENLDPAKNALRGLPCEVWRGFVFISLDPNPLPLAEWLGPIADEAVWFDGLRCAATSSMELKCNWKIAIESNIEVYHITTVHPTTVGLGLDYRGSVHELYSQGHSRMIVPNKGYDSAATQIAAKSNPVDALFDNSNVSYLLFPFHLTPSGARGANGKVGVTLQSFWPLDMDRTLLEWFTLMPDWGDGPAPEIGAENNAYFDKIMDEDTQNMEPVQRSLKSAAFDGVLTSYHERRIYHHEASVDRLIGVDRVPEKLRVPQLLETAD
jgi:phenylpropionate dioxygenase-like ring-hydroxylating dioxygenase large terminal subunit